MSETWRALLRIKDEVRKNTPPGVLPYRIPVIKAAIVLHTEIHEINLMYIDEPTNVIWGRFDKYYMQPAPYEDHVPVAQIRIVEDLSSDDKRLVTCKEMCHCLPVEGNNHHIEAFEELMQLVRTLAVEQIKPSDLTAPVMNEGMALFAALELLCPLEDRLVIIERLAGRDLPVRSIAHDFQIPERYVPMLFSPDYINLLSEQYEAAQR